MASIIRVDGTQHWAGKAPSLSNGKWLKRAFGAAPKGDWSRKPQQNGFIESFNGKLRDESLNETLSGTLCDARQTLEEWQEDYNWPRPHSALGNLTPMEILQSKAMDEMAA